MTINKLGDDRVLITLCHKDMSDFLLDFKKLSLNDSHSRRVLLRILQVACRRSGISTGGKRVNIEAMLFGEDCYLLITLAKKGMHTYRLKRSDYSVCYAADNAEDLLRVTKQLVKSGLYCPKSAVYALDGAYYLIFDSYIPKNIHRVISEFAQKKGGRITAARIREFGKPVCRYNAVSTIGQYL